MRERSLVGLFVVFHHNTHAAFVRDNFLACAQFVFLLYWLEEFLREVLRGRRLCDVALFFFIKVDNLMRRSENSSRGQNNQNSLVAARRVLNDDLEEQIDSSSKL